MFENIDTSLIDWSRAQFALTAIITANPNVRGTKSQ